MDGSSEDSRVLSLTPTWSIASVLTIFIAVSLLVERSIHYLSSWLEKTDRKPLFEALERMKEELMLLGFMSLLLTATSRTISSICIDSKYYGGRFSPCSKSEVEKADEESSEGRKLLMASIFSHSHRRGLIDLNQNSCKKGHEPFVSYEGLEQLHRFIFVMAVTHVTYSCLTMLLAIVKIHTWRIWENEAQVATHFRLPEISRPSTLRKQSVFVKFLSSNRWARNTFLVWTKCFFRQFRHSVLRTDYITLRSAFIANHNLSLRFDFHNYMVSSMEEEFQKIVGVSGPLWGFVVAFMLFDVRGVNLYFWLAIIPVTLVLTLGTKLQHIISTLVWENAGVTETKLRPRDDLFWFKKPELVLSLIHFVLFQNAFELASFFWFWWQFGFNSCFINKHIPLYARLVLGFAGQFLCSYSTLPLYALVTQMGTNYKAALIPRRVRETIHGWNKATKKKRRRGMLNDDSTSKTQTSTIIPVDDDETPTHTDVEIELAPLPTTEHVVETESSSMVATVIGSQRFGERPEPGL